MKKATRIIGLVVGILFGIAAILVAAVTVKISFDNMNALPQLIGPAEEAQQVVEKVMQALDDRDYAQAAANMVGTPDLGMDSEPEDAVGKLFWQAYLDSFSYEIIGECYVTKDGLAQQVKITTMDLNAATEPLREKSQQMLEERVAAAENPDEIYDDKGDYREDFVMEVLLDTAKEVLEGEQPTKSAELILNLKFRSGRWQVVFDDALLKALIGGISG